MCVDLDLDVLTISSGRAAVRERKTTATSLVERFYAKIEAQDRQPGQINAYLNLTRERALRKAKQMDAIADRGDRLPPLGGVPIAIKDVIVTRGIRTTAGSKILGNYIPPYDSTAVSRLEEAGAVILGKLNCDEFAIGSSLDHIGPLAKSAKDAALILRHMAGRDQMDTTSVELPVPNYEQEIGKPVRGLRIGVPKEYFPVEMDAEVRSAVEAGIKRLAD